MKNTNGFILTKDGLTEIKPPKVHYDSRLMDIMNSPNKFKVLEGILPDGSKFDSNETVFLKRALTEINAKVLTAWRPDYTSKIVFPVNNTGGPGLRSIEYSMDSWSGEAKMAGLKNTTMPIVGLNTLPSESPVRYIELAYDYSLYDLQSAIRSGTPLQTRKAMATRDGTEKMLNKLAYGLTKTTEAGGVPGLFNSLDKVIQSSDITGSELNNFNMLTASGPDNRDFLLGVIRQPRSYTKQLTAQPDTLVMPIAQADLIESQPISNDNNETVASYILNKTSINRIIGAPEFENVGKSGITDALLAMRFDDMQAEIRETQPYTTYPVQVQGFQFLVPTNAGTGGLFIYRKSMALVKNVGA